MQNKFFQRGVRPHRADEICNALYIGHYNRTLQIFHTDFRVAALPQGSSTSTRAVACA